MSMAAAALQLRCSCSAARCALRRGAGVCTHAIAFLTAAHPTSPLPQYAFNLFSHTTKVGDNGYNEEEMKMVKETRKIWGVRTGTAQAVVGLVALPHPSPLSLSARSAFYACVCAPLRLRTMIVSLTNYRPELRRLRPRRWRHQLHAPL